MPPDSLGVADNALNVEHGAWSLLIDQYIAALHSRIHSDAEEAVFEAYLSSHAHSVSTSPNYLLPHVASELPARSEDDVREHFRLLEDDIAAIENGHVSLPWDLPPAHSSSSSSMSAQHSQAQNHHHQYQHQRQQQLEASQRQGQPQPSELQPHPRTPLKDHSGAEQEPVFAFAGISPVACAEEHHQNVSSGYREQQQQPHAQHMKNEQWHPPRKAGELANRLLCEGMDAEDEHLISWQQHRSNRGKRKRFAASKAHEPGSKAKRQYQQEQELMHSNAEQHGELFCAASVGKGFGESTSCTKGNASFALERTDPPSSWSAAHEQATTSTAAGAAGSSDATEVQANLLEQPQRPVQIRKNVPWTTEEHRMFLLGLEQYGKGDWRNISKFFVKSRTPTQVASHAQKFYARLSNWKARNKKGNSIHDVELDNEQY